jgi:hypothetical protein
MLEKDVHTELKKVICYARLSTFQVNEAVQVFIAITSGLILCILFSLKFNALFM